MDKNIELLAPAGDWDAFIAAVESGADAVYLGGKLFNARQFAGNFDNEHLKKALDYAHVRGINIYLTLNTLLTDSEIKQAVDYVEEAYLMGIDGVIVQDLGFAGFLRKYIPQLDLHASTQMTVYNPEGVKVLEQLGFKRVVLARELTIEEINRIVKNTSIEVEVFNHGALCVSYSGQCLMSSMIGGRSGNRGKCAQPCRLPYQLLQNGKVVENKSGRYLLSTKDICSLNELDKLINTGIRSLKIEGRMKNPEYVATVVKTYRKYLDMLQDRNVDNSKYKVEKQDMRDITQIFNRGGFTTGYLNGKPGKDLMSYEKPKNWGVLLGEVISYDNYSKLVTIKLSEDIAIGDGMEIWNEDEESPGTIVTEIKVNGKN
ncbi:MAG: peptidase, partial [Clostridiales bacterium]|nr:peptidase [Clostridiales bacterium]